MKNFNLHTLRIRTGLLFAFIFIFASCSLIQDIPEEPDETEVSDEREEVIEDPEEREEEMPEDPDREVIDLERSELGIDLRSYRSTLRDQYANLQLSVPEAYIDTGEEDERQLSNSGFRVQIASTRNVEEADQHEADFKEWADTMDFQIKPEVYITFRQPNYRVHVGDFLSRSDAITFSNIVKQKFEDAWVVRDRIDTRALLRALEEEEDLKQDELAEDPLDDDIDEDEENDENQDDGDDNTSPGDNF